MLFLSVSFSILLIAVRIFYTDSMAYFMFTWNLFLAVIPVLFSRMLVYFNKINLKSLLALAIWMLFLPNAPYLITDIFHFTEMKGMPAWFDLLLVTSAAWNGLMLAIVSLLQVEDFFQKFMSKFKVNMIMFASIFTCSYGIYLGRYLRFNSWDVVTAPISLVKSIGYQVLFPHQNIKTWAFTVLFGAMIWLVYYTIKNLPSLVKPLAPGYRNS